MGESVNAVTLPGSTKVSTGAPGLGGRAITVGAASSHRCFGKHLVTVDAAQNAERTASATSTISTMIRRRIQLYAATTDAWSGAFS